jgi:hypothetical protein
MSNYLTTIKVKSLDSKSLLTNPNIVVLDTKDKLILNNISINLDTSIIDQIQASIITGIDILGLEAEVTRLATSNNEVLLESQGYILITND